MAVRIYVDGNRVGPLFKRGMVRKADQVRTAVRSAAQDAAKEIQTKGRADIAKAGNFGSRWTDGFNAAVSEGGGNIRINVTEDVPYWTVFQYGKVIHGKPLLFIPFDFADDAKGVSAKNYPGPLFRVTRKRDGLIMLFTPGKPAVPKYFGKESVTIPKKFHLIEIARASAKRMGEFFSKRFKQNG